MNPPGFRLKQIIAVTETDINKPAVYFFPERPENIYTHSRSDVILKCGGQKYGKDQ